MRKIIFDRIQDIITSSNSRKEKDNSIQQLIFEDLGIYDNPKRFLLWEKAWDLGHSAGYHEVYGCALDLVELIR